MLNNKCAVADFGNSRVKIIAGGKHDAFHYGDYDEIIRFIAQAGTRVLGYSSVNPAESDLILSKLFSDVVKVVPPDALISSQKRVDFSGVRGMGTDRAFGLVAASVDSTGSFATVDCGTAVTVNIAGDGKAVGGGIFCGFYTQHRAFKKYTAGIRNVKPDFKVDFPGDNTKDAVNSGIILSIAGGIRLMIEKYEAATGTKFKKIYFTGGYADEIAGLTGFDSQFVIIDENLVLRGVSISLEDFNSGGSVIHP